MVATNSYRSKSVLILLVVVLNLCDTSDYILNCNFKDISDTVELFGFYVIPSIIKNSMLTYLAFKIGYRLTIIYRLFLELPLYFLPIFPRIGQYGQIIVNILMPVIIFAWFYKVLKKDDKALFYYKHRWIRYTLMILIATPVFACIILTSGLFKHFAVAVGSESMTPNICKGDTVIVEKLNKSELRELKVGDVLVYKISGKTIIHRIQEINIFEEEYYFSTKGDYNSSADGYSVNQNEVIGVAIAKIPWIGMPTVWVKNLSNF